MPKLYCRGSRASLVSLGVQELTIQDTMWCVVQLLGIFQDALDLGLEGLKKVVGLIGQYE